MAQTFDVLGYIDALAEVFVLSVVVDGVVDDNTINVRINVCVEDIFFNGLAGDFAQGVAEVALFILKSFHLSHQPHDSQL